MLLAKSRRFHLLQEPEVCEMMNRLRDGSEAWSA